VRVCEVPRIQQRGKADHPVYPGGAGENVWRTGRPQSAGYRRVGGIDQRMLYAWASVRGGDGGGGAETETGDERLYPRVLF
jgi:hypothetical protein